jgi:hypothetical protein
MKLPLAPILNPGEPPTSYLSRLARANGVSAREFCSDWGIKFQDVVEGNAAALDAMAELGGVPAADLMRFAFIRGEGFAFEHRGEKLVRDLLRRRRIMVCPACLVHDIQSNPKTEPLLATHNRADWSLDAVRVCAVHDAELVEVADGKDWDTRHDFVNLLEPHVDRLGALARRAKARQPTDLERYVLSRLAGVAGQAEFLDKLDLHVAIRICEVVGAVDLFGSKVVLSRLTEEQRHLAADRGFVIAAGGETAIEMFLRDMHRSFARGRGTNEGSSGPPAAFGSLYRFLKPNAKGQTKPKDADFAPVRMFLADFIKRNFSLGPGDSVFGEPIGERRLHSVHTLAIEAGLNPFRLRKVLRASGIVGEEQMGYSYNNVVFDAEAGRAAVAKASDALSLSGAADRLGTAPTRAAYFVAHFLIKPFLHDEKFGMKPRFAVSDLDAFMSRLLYGARRVTVPNSQRMTIAAATRRANCSAATIVRLILDQKLGWVGRQAGKKGYESVLVDIDEVREKVRVRGHGGLGTRQVAAALKTSDWVATALIGGGHLSTSVARNAVNRRQTVVMPEEIERFKAEYVSAWTLCLERKKHVSLVKLEMERNGVRPAFDPEIVGTVFYRRSEISG